MKTRIRKKTSPKKNTTSNIYTFYVFLVFTGLLIGFTGMHYYGIIGFFLNIFIFLSILGVYKYKIGKRDYHFIYKSEEIDTSIHDVINILNHQNYFKDMQLQKHITDFLWKEIYYVKYITQSFGILTGLIVIIMLIVFIITQIQAFVSLNSFINWLSISIVLILIILSFIWIFLLRRMYKKKLKDPYNRYFFYNIQKKSYTLTRQKNSQGAYDYIFKKL